MAPAIGGWFLNRGGLRFPFGQIPNSCSPDFNLNPSSPLTSVEYPLDGADLLAELLHHDVELLHQLLVDAGPRLHVLELHQHLEGRLRAYQHVEALVQEEFRLVLEEVDLLEEQGQGRLPVLLVELVEYVVIGVQYRQHQPVHPLYHRVDLGWIADDRLQVGAENVVEVLENVGDLVQTVADRGYVLGPLEQPFLVELPPLPLPGYLDVLAALQVSLLPAPQHRAGGLRLLQNRFQRVPVVGNTG